MLKYLTNLWLVRALVILGFILGMRSVGYTIGHIGDELMLLTPDSRLAQTHSWHHYFREVFGDFGAMAAILIILFATPRFRNPITWWVMLVLMLGFYAPFWVGTPFMAELAAPSMGAEILHLQMAVPPLLACFLARRHFFGTTGT